MSDSGFMNNTVVKWIEHRMPIFAWTQKELIDYPAPRNLNYWWNFGFPYSPIILGAWRPRGRRIFRL